MQNEPTELLTLNQSGEAPSSSWFALKYSSRLKRPQPFSAFNINNAPQALFYF